MPPHLNDVRLDLREEVNELHVCRKQHGSRWRGNQVVHRMEEAQLYRWAAEGTTQQTRQYAPTMHAAQLDRETGVLPKK